MNKKNSAGRILRRRKLFFETQLFEQLPEVAAAAHTDKPARRMAGKHFSAICGSKKQTSVHTFSARSRMTRRVGVPSSPNTSRIWLSRYR